MTTSEYDITELASLIDACFVMTVLMYAQLMPDTYINRLEEIIKERLESQDIDCADKIAKEVHDMVTRLHDTMKKGEF